MKEVMQSQQKGKKKKKKELVDQTQKDRSQHYELDGVSMDDDDEIIVSGEKPESKHPH